MWLSLFGLCHRQRGRDVGLVVGGVRLVCGSSGSGSFVMVVAAASLGR